MFDWAVILFTVALVVAVVGWIGLTGTSRAVYLLFLCIIIGLALVALLTTSHQEKTASSGGGHSHRAVAPVDFLPNGR